MSVKNLILVKFYTFTAKVIVRLLYRLKFSGFDKIPKTGPVLIIANHVSYMDGVIIQSGCRRPIRFVIDQYIYEKPFIKHVMGLARAIPILAKKESVGAALDEISRALENGDAVGIFPEGQLTYTGALGRFKPGIEWIVDRDPVPIYPIVLDGLWGSVFSRKYLKSNFRWMPRCFRMPVDVVCGDAIHPESATVDELQRAILGIK